MLRTWPTSPQAHLGFAVRPAMPASGLRITSFGTETNQADLGRWRT